MFDINIKILNEEKLNNILLNQAEINKKLVEIFSHIKNKEIPDEIIEQLNNILNQLKQTV